MSTVILLVVYVLTALLFLAAALSIGMLTDIWFANLSSLIFVADVGIAMGLAWPVALWLTRGIPDSHRPTT